MIYKVDKNLNYKRVRNIRPVFNISVTLNVILLLTVIYSFKYPEQILTSKVIRDTVMVEVPDDIKLTDSAITAELVKLGCVLPNVALAQFKIETGHFTSSICKDNKNIAGIRNSSSNLSIGKNRGHNMYNTYKDCLKDYVRIQNKYLKNIDKKYAENPGYVEYIRKIK
jgi:hypothetical protein